MSKIGTFNRASAEAISKEVREIFAAHKDRLLEKYGVEITTGNGTFSDRRFTLKLEIAAVDESGLAATKSAEDFKRYIEDIGWTGKSIVAAFEAGPDFYFIHKGKRYFVEGYRPRSRKFPYIIAEVADPKKRVCVGAPYLIALIEKAKGFDQIAKARGALERQESANG